MLDKMIKKILKIILQILFAVYEAETNLIFVLVAEAQAQSLKGEEARAYVLRKFRERYKDELKDSLLNLLVEAVVVSTK